MQMIARICNNGNSKTLWRDYKVIQTLWGKILDYHANICIAYNPTILFQVCSQDKLKHTHQEAGTWIYSSTGYNSGKLETSKVSITRRRE